MALDLSRNKLWQALTATLHEKGDLQLKSQIVYVLLIH